MVDLQNSVIDHRSFIDNPPHQRLEWGVNCDVRLLVHDAP
jgi:hypothetical protein